jgi:3-hydroxybutyryl-CoA dehydratase
MKVKTINDIAPGDTASFTKTVTEADVYNFAGVTGDFNPAHINEEYAKGTFFKTRIAHGMLSAGFISNVLGTQLPGPGCVYIKQDIRFLAPVYFNDTITAKVEVIEVIREKNRVSLKTTCSNQDGTLVMDGNALMSPAK